MSKLGKIFVIRYREGAYSKEVYPVVYKNQERYVCKVPGSYTIKEFVKGNSYFCVMSVEEFYREVQKGLNSSHAYTVFVGNDDHIDFEKYRTVSTNEIKLKKLESKLIYDRGRIEIWKKDIQDAQARIEKKEEDTVELEKKIEELKVLIEKEKTNE